MNLYHQNSLQKTVSNTPQDTPVLLSTPANGPFISGVPEDWEPFLNFSDVYKPLPELLSVDLEAKWMRQPKLDRNLVRPQPTEPPCRTLSNAELQSLCSLSYTPTAIPIPIPRANVEFEFDWDPYQAGSTGVWIPKEIEGARETVPSRPVVKPNPPFRDVFAVGRRRCSWDYVSSESSDESSEEEDSMRQTPPRVVRSPPICELFRPPSVPSLEEEPDIPDFWKEEPPTPPPRNRHHVPTLPDSEPVLPSASSPGSRLCSISGEATSNQNQSSSLAATQSQPLVVPRPPAHEPAQSTSPPDSHMCSPSGEAASNQNQLTSMAPMFLNQSPVVSTLPVQSVSPPGSPSRSSLGEAASPRTGISAPSMSTAGNSQQYPAPEGQAGPSNQQMALANPRKRPARVAFPNRPGKVIKYSKADIVCRVHGCPNVSKTVHECLKHRDTHFPPRYQCPGCSQRYGRSSALKRHLEKTKGCAKSAGPVNSWGVNMARFSTHESEWLSPGILHEYTESS